MEETAPYQTYIKFFIGIILLMVVLFAPIPSVILGDVFCHPCKMGQVCPRCPQKGDFVWQPSLGQQLYRLLFNKPKLISIEEPVTPTLTQVADPITDWKTYNNSDYNFSLEYPSDWIMNKYDNKTISFIFDDSSQPEVLLQDGTVNLAKYVVDIKITTGTSSDYFDRFSSLPIDKIEVGKVQGVKFKLPAMPSSGLSTIVLIQKDPYIYEFS